MVLYAKCTLCSHSYFMNWTKMRKHSAEQTCSDMRHHNIVIICISEVKNECRYRLCLINWLLDKARSHTIQDNSTFFPLTASHLKGQFLPQFMPLSMDLPLVGYLLSVALDVVKWKQKSSIKPHGDDKTTCREAVFQAAGERTRAIVIFSSNSILNL